MSHALVWVRRDLRLADNPALRAALEAGHSPLLVYVHAPEEEGDWAPGAASRAWLARSLLALDSQLSGKGSALVVLNGPSGTALASLARRVGAVAVYWTRCYEPASIKRDATVKALLRGEGLEARSFNGALLVEPWQVHTGDGRPYRVFTPFWRKASGLLAECAPWVPPRTLPAPPDGVAEGEQGADAIEALDLRPTLDWDAGFWERFEPGEVGALEALEAFIEGAATSYLEQRNLPDRAGTSRLSPHLHFGEITPWRIMHELRRAGLPKGAQAQVEGYIRELGWREFSHHLLFHFPGTAEDNLNPRFSDFDWADAERHADALQAWRRGRTGVPIVDAGMRELWHTGWMHNRVRMIVASFLTKNLRLHWRHGARWFWDTLVDANLANNTQGWQWTAGTGADAAPYFRIFNPVTQAARFDTRGTYIRRWCPELAQLPDKALYAPWEHEDTRKELAPEWPGQPIVDLKASRERALAAYQRTKASR
jgi:deoxyribodipyrimidine photo-lyase